MAKTQTLNFHLWSTLGTWYPLFPSAATCLMVETLFASCCICAQSSLDCEACVLALVGLEGLCLWEAVGTPHADSLLLTHSFSPVLTPFRRHCGMRRREERRKRNGRRSARVHAFPARSRSCSTLGLVPCSGGDTTGTQSGLLPSQQP